MSRAEIQREKLLNAIIFFAKNTRACHKLKLFKLLYFLDFQIFRQTGRATTGLGYFAWPMGPVPKDLFEELNAPRPDMSAALVLAQTNETDPDFTTKRLLIKPRRSFDPGCFTPRELAAMERLAEIFREATADQMSEVSHIPGEPWHKVFKIDKKPQSRIPYSLVLDSQLDSITEEQADQIDEEEREALALFK